MILSGEWNEGQDPEVMPDHSPLAVWDKPRLNLGHQIRFGPPISVAYLWKRAFSRIDPWCMVRDNLYLTNHLNILNSFKSTAVQPSCLSYSKVGERNVLDLPKSCGRVPLKNHQQINILFEIKLTN